MDPALALVAAAAVTASAALMVALVNDRREKRTAATSAIDAVYRERLAFKDEQIAELRRRLGQHEPQV